MLFKFRKMSENKRKFSGERKGGFQRSLSRKVGDKFMHSLRPAQVLNSVCSKATLRARVEAWHHNSVTPGRAERRVGINDATRHIRWHVHRKVNANATWPKEKTPVLNRWITKVHY